MCGICGVAGHVPDGSIDGLVRALAHRGPDDRGIFVDRSASVALGHTRLSIIELTEAGHQPMQSADGQVTIIFNGEIYNHMDVRAELGARHQYRGRSDTETILCAYLTWGKSCVTRLNGMFAFAIWDARIGELWLVRDRLGIKPLYYSLRAGELRFASEIRAITSDPRWPRELDLEAVDAFLRLRYVPHPRTLVAGIHSLPPGCALSWSARGGVQISSYWAPQWGRSSASSPREARERFTSLLDDSVKLNLMSDVPLGVFLSGGLDSTLVTAIARTHHSKMKTFSVAFEGDDEDARSAAIAAQALDCEHKTISCRVEDLARLPEVAAGIDQPVGDAVILPIYMLNQAARRDVKVVLTGEGADEILMGYAHQSQLMQLASLAPLLGLPGVAPVINLAAKVLPLRFWDFFFSYGSSLGAAGVERMLKLIREVDSAARSYLNYTSLFGEDERVALYSGMLSPFARRTAPSGLDVSMLDRDKGNLRRELMQLELQTWLPSNILTKQDSLSMAHGLEARVPYLDHRLVEEVVSWDEPTFSALARGKRILSDELARRAPSLARRKKRAFRLDFHPAFRPALLGFVEDVVMKQNAVLGSLISRGYVRDLVRNFDESPFLRGKQLAALVVLEAWLHKNIAKNAKD